jgi:hypothetical protein
MVAAIVTRTINIAVAAPTTVVALIVAARWSPEVARPSEVALLPGAEPQFVEEAHGLPIVPVEVDAAADTKRRRISGFV